MLSVEFLLVIMVLQEKCKNGVQQKMQEEAESYCNCAQVTRVSAAREYRDCQQAASAAARAHVECIFKRYFKYTF